MKILQENNTKILKLKLILYYSYLWQRAKYLSYVKLFFENKGGQKLEKIILIKYLTFNTSFFLFSFNFKMIAKQYLSTAVYGRRSKARTLDLHNL